MRQSIPWNSKWLLFSLPLLMILSLVALTQTAFFQQQTATLSNAILLDLLVTVPFIYFLIIRKREVPKITVVSLFIVGIIIASFILPIEHQFWLDKVKMIALPIAELGILSFVLLQTYKTVRNFKQQKNTNSDFYTAVRVACKEALPPRLSSIAATEVAMIYYSLFSWKKRILRPNEYSYHIKSGTPALLLAFIFIILVEVFVLHIIVQQWSPLAAWILTALSVYTGLQVFALVRSIIKRPIVLDADKGELVVRFGFFSESTIKLDIITAIELTTSPLPEDKSIVPLSPIPDLTPHNVVLHLKEAVQIEQLYGRSKKGEAIAFYVDEKAAFVERVKELLVG